MNPHSLGCKGHACSQPVGFDSTQALNIKTCGYVSAQHQPGARGASLFAGDGSASSKRCVSSVISFGFSYYDPIASVHPLVHRQFQLRDTGLKGYYGVFCSLMSMVST